MGHFNYKKWVSDYKNGKKLFEAGEETIKGIEMPDISTLAGLAKFFLDKSKEIRDGQYTKDFTSAEINNVDDLITLVLAAVGDDNVTNIIQRLEDLVAKKIDDTGEETPSDETSDKSADFTPLDTDFKDIEI
jgi:hypothetical protein